MHRGKHAGIGIEEVTEIVVRRVFAAEHRAMLGHIRFDKRMTHAGLNRDRKSTRLNSSHVAISYAVFCLKKKTAPQQAKAYIAEPPEPGTQTPPGATRP